MAILKKLIPNLVELNFNNLTFLGNRDIDENITMHDILVQLIQCTGGVGSKLMKLKLSNINLHS